MTTILSIRFLFNRNEMECDAEDWAVVQDVEGGTDSRALAKLILSNLCGKPVTRVMFVDGDDHSLCRSNLK